MLQSAARTADHQLVHSDADPKTAVLNHRARRRLKSRPPQGAEFTLEPGESNRDRQSRWERFQHSLSLRDLSRLNELQLDRPLAGLGENVRLTVDNKRIMLRLTGIEISSVACKFTVEPVAFEGRKIVALRRGWTERSSYAQVIFEDARDPVDVVDLTFI